MTDWQTVDDHPFVGMTVRATLTEGAVVEGAITTIHEFDGEPRRLEIERDDVVPLHIDRDRVEVVG